MSLLIRLMRFYFGRAYPLIIPLTCHATGDTLRVPADFPSIQAAINASQDGDHIEIAAQNYEENLIIEGRTLYLDGAVSAEEIVRVTASHQNSPESALTVLNSASVEVSRMIFIGAGKESTPPDTTGTPIPGSSGIRCTDSTVTVLSCELKGGSGTDGPNSGFFSSGGNGGSAMRVTGASLVLVRSSQLSGGGGGRGGSTTTAGAGGSGGSAIAAEAGSFVRLGDSEFIGGGAGSRGSSTGTQTLGGSDGGHGILAQGACSVIVKRCALTGGSGTAGAGFPAGEGGPGGDGVHGRSGMRVGGTTDLTYSGGTPGSGGVPGELFDLDGTSSGFTNFPAIGGHIIGTSRLTGRPLLGADSNADGVINAADVVRSNLAFHF